MSTSVLEPAVACPADLVTSRQRHDLEVFGYTVFRGLFDPAEVADYAAAMEAVHPARRGGDAAGRRPEKVTPLVEHDPATFGRLLDDDRLAAVAEGLLGEDCLYTGSFDGNLFGGDTPWHVDGGGLATPLLLKTALYCDPLRAGGGALCVLPGSHHPDFFQRLYRCFFEERTLDARSPRVPGATPVESDPGDLIVFDHRLWHASFGGRPGRRQIALSWSARPRHSWEELWLRGYLGWVNDRHGRRMLSDRLVRDGGERRRRRVQRLLDMGL